LRGEGARREA